MVFAIFGMAQLGAQTTTSGELSGTVTDPSAALVANADVTLRNSDTGSTSRTKTNTSGYYKFPYLQPGNYTAIATAAGFQKTEKSASVNLGSSVTTNFQLSLSSAQTTVEVSA